MPTSYRLIGLSASLVVAIIIVVVSSVVARSQDFGRTSATGNWADANWVDASGQIGPILFDGWSFPSVVIGRAGSPGSSALGVASVDVSDEFPATLGVVQVGGDSGDKGILSIQSGGYLRSHHTVIGTDGGEGIVNVAEDGSLAVEFSLVIGPNGSITSSGDVDAGTAYDVTNQGTITINGGQFRTWDIDQTGGSLFLNGGLLDAGAYRVNHGELHLVAGILKSNGVFHGLQLKDSYVTRTDDVIFEGTVSLDNTELELGERDQVFGVELKNNAMLSLASNQLFGQFDMQDSLLKLNNHIATVDLRLKQGSVIDRGGHSGGITSSFTIIEGSEYTYEGSDRFTGYLDIGGAANFVVNKDLNLSAGPNAFLTVAGHGTNFVANAPVLAQSLHCRDYAKTELFEPVTAQNLSASDYGKLYIHDSAQVEFLAIGIGSYMQIAQDSRRTDGVTVGQAIYAGFRGSLLDLVFDGQVVPGELDWVLRWAGDKRTLIAEMLESAIRVEGAPRPVEVIYDPLEYGDFTYIGYIAEVPEPSAWVLVGTYLSVSVGRRRRC